MLAEIATIVTCILWLDASGDVGWQDPSEYEPSAPILSCGQLVEDAGDYVVLAMDRDLTGDLVNQVGSIPKGMVVVRIDTKIEIPDAEPFEIDVR